MGLYLDTDNSTDNNRHADDTFKRLSVRTGKCELDVGTEALDCLIAKQRAVVTKIDFLGNASATGHGNRNVCRALIRIWDCT